MGLYCFSINLMVVSSIFLAKQFQSMQSQSPCIIRHFIPLNFSKQAVDMPTSPLRRTYTPKEDNPLQNIKLRAMENATNPEFTLTFINKTSKDYRPKHALQYKHLLETIKEEQNKMNIMLAVTKLPKEQTLEDRKRKDQNSHKQKNWAIKGKKNLGTVLLLPKQQPLSHKIIRNKTCQPQRRINLTQRETVRVRSRASQRNIASSTSARWWNQNIEQEQFRHSRTAPTKNSLRIKGSRAPQNQVVDHLRRNSMKDIRKAWEDY